MYGYPCNYNDTSWVWLIIIIIFLVLFLGRGYGQRNITCTNQKQNKCC